MTASAQDSDTMARNHADHDGNCSSVSVVANALRLNRVTL